MSGSNGKFHLVHSHPKNKSEMKIAWNESSLYFRCFGGGFDHNQDCEFVLDLTKPDDRIREIPNKEFLDVRFTFSFWIETWQRWIGIMFTSTDEGTEGAWEEGFYSPIYLVPEEIWPKPDEDILNWAKKHNGLCVRFWDHPDKSSFKPFRDEGNISTNHLVMCIDPITKSLVTATPEEIRAPLGLFASEAELKFKHVPDKPHWQWE